MTAEYILPDACGTSTAASSPFLTWFALWLEPLLLPLSRKRLFTQYFSQVPERLILPAIKFTQQPQLNSWSFRFGGSGLVQIIVVCVSRTKVNEAEMQRIIILIFWLQWTDIQLLVGVDFIR